MMTELDEPFSVVDVSFKYYVEKYIPVRNLLPRKKTESVRYDVAQSY